MNIHANTIYAILILQYFLDVYKIFGLSVVSVGVTGWWLSMEPEDCFVQRIPTISALAENVNPEKRFEGGNRHTLGILLVGFIHRTGWSTLFN